MNKPTSFDYFMTFAMSAIIGAFLALVYLDTIGAISVYEILDF
jgi:hypothetical protein